MNTGRPANENNEQEYLRLLAELPPDERLRLLGEDFNLGRQLLRKRQYRRAIARLAPAQKLQLLEELRKRSQIQKGVRRSLTLKRSRAVAREEHKVPAFRSVNLHQRSQIRL